MGLFNKFNKAIFLKDDSDLEKQLEELKSIRNSLSNTEEIDKDIKKLEYGIIGEKQIKFELENSHIGMYVLHDVTYECDGNKAQIDYVIFTRGYIYIVECKNLYGNITVDNNGQFYRDYEMYGKKVKESIYSPYTQAVRHKEIIKRIWGENHNTLDKMLYSKANDNTFIPLVVLSNPKCFLNTRYAPKDIKNNIIRADQLVNLLKKGLKDFGNFDLSSEKDTKEAAQSWLEKSIQNNTDITSKYKNQIKTDSIIKELKDFRIEKAKRMNIPEDYIFNEQELTIILDKKPKTIEELSSILPEIKTKYHGEEILNILNK